MRVRTIGVTLGLALFALVFAFWAFDKDDVSSIEIQKKIMRKAGSIGSKEDPEARSRWEFQRLHSPSLRAIPAGIRAKELSFASTLPIKDISKGLAKGQAFTWSKRGPRNVGGRTRGFGIDVSDPNILLAGGVSGGMWRSTNDGVSWVKTSDPTHLHSVTTLAQNTKAGQTATWYYGTGEYSGNSASGGGSNAFLSGDGVYKSTNNGASWVPLGATVSGTPQTFDSFFDYVWKIAIDTSKTPSHVYAATYGRVLRSTDGGTTWPAVHSSTSPYSNKTDVVVNSGGVVYAAASSGSAISGIYRSTSGGSGTYVNITPAGFPTAYGRPIMAVAPNNQNVVYLLLQGTNGTEGVNQRNSHQIWKYTYISGDGSGGGGTWVNKGVSLPNESGVSDNAVFSTQGGYDMTLFVKPDNENFVVIGGVNLYRTADFSVTTPTWTRIGGYAGPSNYSQYTNHHPDQHSGMFRPGSNIILYTGHDGGITKTADVTATTVAWSVLNNDYVTSQFYTIGIDHGTSGNAEIIGGLQDNGTWWTNSTNPAVDWVSQFSGDGAACAIADGRTSYYVSSQNGTSYRLVLNGSGALVDYARVDPSGGSGYQFINPFVLNPNDTKMMYMAAGTTIWRNSDLTGVPTVTVSPGTANSATAVNWSQMTATNVNGRGIVAVAASKTPANRLYYGTYFFDGANDASALFRVDAAHTGNPTPSEITGAGFPAAFLSCIAVNPSNADEVIAVFSNYEVPSLFRTTNGGTTWTDVSGNLEQNMDGSGNGPSCRWAAIVPTTAGPTYFVATSTGLYSATTPGTWSQEGATTIGSVVCDMIDFRTSDGLIVVATHGNGVFSTNIVVSSPTVESTIPSDFVLNQNFPNPFNPSTTIRYSLPERSHVRIHVYDAAGREITLLRDRSEGAGHHEVQWNAKDARGNPVSSGVYFYTLTAVGDGNETKFTKTERMTYVK